MGLEVGAKLGRYRIDALLGQGGMGEVYKAFDSRLDREVALKVLRRFEAESDEDYRERVERFLREARLAAKLKHPNIVTIFDVDEVEGLPLFSMELLEGRTLRDAIEKPHPLSVRLDWLRQLADALEASHRAGLIHRDVKPENVMVTGDDIKLVDFGIAKPVVDDSANLTLPGYAVGTPRYMAPEHLLGLELDARADQYAWGIVAYELLSGEHPGTTPLPLDEAGAAPAEVARLVARAMSRAPDQRFASMKDLKVALEVAAAAEQVTREAPVQRVSEDAPTIEAPAPAAPSPKPSSAPRQKSKRKAKRPSTTARKRRKRLGLAALVVGIAASASILTYMLAKRAPSQPVAATPSAGPRSGPLRCKLDRITEVSVAHEPQAPVTTIAGLRVVGGERNALVIAQGELARKSSGWRLLGAKLSADGATPRAAFSTFATSPIPDDLRRHYAATMATGDIPFIATTSTLPHPTRRPGFAAITTLTVDSVTTRVQTAAVLPLFDKSLDLAWAPVPGIDGGSEDLLTARNTRAAFAGEAIKDAERGEPAHDAGEALPSAGGYVGVLGCLNTQPSVVHTSNTPETSIGHVRVAATRTRTGVVFVDDDRAWFATLDSRCIHTGKNVELDAEGVSAPLIAASGDDFIVTWTKRRVDGAYFQRFSIISREGLVSPPAPFLRDDLDTPLLRLRSSSTLVGAAWLEHEQIRLAVSQNSLAGFQQVPLLDDVWVSSREVDLAVAGSILWVAWETTFDHANVARIDCGG